MPQDVLVVPWFEINITSKENSYACFISKEVRNLVKKLIDIISHAKLPTDNFDVNKAITESKQIHPDLRFLLNQALDSLPTIDRS